jgi:hypothetical protein
MNDAEKETDQGLQLRSAFPFVYSLLLYLCTHLANITCRALSHLPIPSSPSPYISHLPKIQTPTKPCTSTHPQCRTFPSDTVLSPFGSVASCILVPQPQVPSKQCTDACPKNALPTRETACKEPRSEVRALRKRLRRRRKGPADVLMTA